jgi:hypothetical protein
MALQNVLDPPVEALHHSVRLRPHWRGEAMLDPQFSAEVIELVRAGGGTAAEAKETVGEFLPVARQEVLGWRP